MEKKKRIERNQKMVHKWEMARLQIDLTKEYFTVFYRRINSFAYFWPCEWTNLYSCGLNIGVICLLHKKKRERNMNSYLFFFVRWSSWYHSHYGLQFIILLKMYNLHRKKVSISDILDASCRFNFTWIILFFFFVCVFVSTVIVYITYNTLPKIGWNKRENFGGFILLF